MVSGISYKIHTEHFYWFRFAEMLQDRTSFEIDHLFVDEPPENKNEAFKALIEFYHEDKEIPRSTGSGEKVLDYKIDSDLIYAGILHQYGIDLFEKGIHWHKVRAMLAGMHDTRLSDVIGYRCYSGNDKEMRKIKASWDLPIEMSEAEKESENRFLSKLKKRM